MSPDAIVFIAIGLFLFLLLLECPVGFSLGISGATGLVLLRDAGVARSVLAGTPFDTTATYAYVVVPMFVLIGMFALNGNIANQVYSVANHAFRRVRGGLGIATVMACAGFAAVTGSSVATAATIGRISIREMVKRGYPPHFAAGIVAAAGTLGVLIPPSVILVLYSIVSGESIAAMLAAGIIPGILSALLYTAYILVRGGGVVRDTKEGDEDTLNPATASGREALAFRGLFYVLVLFVIVIGGIYSGLFTPTESGALGAIVALGIMLFENRRGGLRGLFSALAESLKETASITSMAFSIVVGAAIFTFFLVSAGVPGRLTSWVVDLDAPATMIVILLLLAMVPLGMALDPISIVLITVPLVYPVVIALGFDGIWFGVVMVKMVELSLITPPVGLNVYVAAGGSQGVATAEQGFRGVLPFGLIDLLTVGVLFVFPQLVTWLPERFMG